MTSNDFLTDEELKHLDTNQRNIYSQFEKKSAVKKYSTLCVIYHMCPKCGSDLNDSNVCYKCDSQFSIIGKEIPIDRGCGH